MHWVYVLRCEDNHIYVGETTQLFTRWNKHVEGCGSANTHTWSPKKILAIYKVGNNTSFFNYKYFAEELRDFRPHYLAEWGDETYIASKTQFETYITEWLKHHYKSVNHWDIAGGSHCKFGFRFLPSIKEPGYDRPTCLCGLPTEVNYSRKNDYIYFTCPRSWRETLLGQFDSLDYDEPCTFWQKYTGDKEARDAKDRRQAKWTPPPRSLGELRALFQDD